MKHREDANHCNPVPQKPPAEPLGFKDVMVNFVKRTHVKVEICGIDTQGMEGLLLFILFRGLLNIPGSVFPPCLHFVHGVVEVALLETSCSDVLQSMVDFPLVVGLLIYTIRHRPQPVHITTAAHIVLVALACSTTTPVKLFHIVDAC